MSAWLLNKYEIDVLVHWMFKTGTVQKRTSPDALGKTLWSENYRSIRARYGAYNRNGHFVKRPEYRYATPKARHYKSGKFFDPEDMDQALMLCHFYDYQSCETGDAYYLSRSGKLIHKLMKHLEAQGADWRADNLHWGEPNGGFTEEALLPA